MSRLSTTLLLLFASPAPCTFAQVTHVYIRNDRQFPALPASRDLIARMIRSLDTQRLQPIPRGTVEREVFEAGRNSLQSVVTLDLVGRQERGAYTEETLEGDTLIAYWEGKPGGAERGVWLWDSPTRTTLVLELDPPVITAKRLAGYCETLFRWDKPPLGINKLELFFQYIRDRQERVVGAADHARSEINDLGMGLVATTVDGRAYVWVEITKPFFRSEYPQWAFQVNERFPPLSTRLAHRSRSMLFQEIGKGYDSPRLKTYPVSRDRTVMRELLSRGELNEEEFRQVAIGGLARRDWSAVNSRLVVFLEVLEERNEVALYAAAFKNLVLSAKLEGGLQGAAAAHVFGAMEKGLIDFTEVQLQLVERGSPLAGVSLIYLGRNANSKNALQRISEAKLPFGMEFQREDAIKSIKRRIGIKVEDR